jgi:hypothetical protein
MAVCQYNSSKAFRGFLNKFLEIIIFAYAICDVIAGKFSLLRKGAPCGGASVFIFRFCRPDRGPD